MDLTKTKYSFLIQRYKNKIYSYSLYMLKNRMDADDVTQEVFIRIWQHIDKFNVLSAKSWIMRTTHNLCIDFLRRRAVMLKKGAEITEWMEEEIADTCISGNPFVKTEAADMELRIKNAIGSLPQNLKSVFVLHEIDGLKYKEISKVLDMPQNSVKVYLMRARIKLQDELKSYAVKGTVK
jgi:RNA polymerase sigma-70 factor (ECF subfamily)